MATKQAEQTLHHNHAFIYALCARNTKIQARQFICIRKPETQKHHHFVHFPLLEFRNGDCIVVVILHSWLQRKRFRTRTLNQFILYFGIHQIYIRKAISLEWNEGSSGLLWKFLDRFIKRKTKWALHANHVQVTSHKIKKNEVKQVCSLFRDGG